MLLVRDGYEIDDDPGRLDLEVVHRFLAGSYWAEGVPRDVVERSVANSLSLGLYHGGTLVGFSRAVTDRATFAWLSDVFVLPGHRGRGLGHWMIEALRAHRDLAGIRRFMLATSDAHQVYADCGFTPLADPGRYMEIRRSPRELYGVPAPDWQLPELSGSRAIGFPYVPGCERREECVIMLPDELSVRQRAVMFALLAEARKLSNPELEERIGFRLDGKERRKLNDLKLVDSDKLGRTYVHELSDAGWRWCSDQLSAGPGGRGTSMERALYAVLGGLGRYLSASGQRLADVFKQRHDAGREDDADVEACIEAVYRALARGSGEFVKLRELRSRLPEIRQAVIDSALGKMYTEQRVNLIPQSNQQALTDADRESALRIGGEYKHLISIEY